MRVAAALLTIVALAYSCSRDDDLVPLGILTAVALGVLLIVRIQLRDESNGWRTRLRSDRPANDNARRRP